MAGNCLRAVNPCAKLVARQRLTPNSDSEPCILYIYIYIHIYKYVYTSIYLCIKLLSQQVLYLSMHRRLCVRLCLHVFTYLLVCHI